MRVMISPSEMSALAANASAALNILSRGGNADEDVLDGLAEGAHFCEVLANGDEVHKSASHFFSAERIAASEFRDLVFEMPGVTEVTSVVPDPMSEMQSIREAVSQSAAAITEDLREKSIKLAAYFDYFAIKLPFFEAIRDRMVADTRNRP